MTAKLWVVITGHLQRTLIIKDGFVPNQLFIENYSNTTLLSATFNSSI